MSLHQSLPLYGMRSHMSSSLQDILQSLRNADKVMMVMTVSTDQISQVKADLTYLELWIHFYPDDTQMTWDDEKQLLN